VYFFQHATTKRPHVTPNFLQLFCRIDWASSGHRVHSGHHIATLSVIRCFYLVYTPSRWHDARACGRHSRLDRSSRVSMFRILLSPNPSGCNPLLQICSQPQQANCPAPQQHLCFQVWHHLHLTLLCRSRLIFPLTLLCFSDSIH
jgi:hypothetical protein